MTIRRFIIKTFIKIIIYACFSIITQSLLNSSIITNEFAILQMEHSNGFYMMMDTYNKVSPLISIIYGFITIMFAWTVINDAYQFIKTKTNKGEN